MIATSKAWREHPRSRPGGALVAALVCLLVAMLVGAALVRSIAIQHRGCRDEVRHLQSMWLAESAASRAAASLMADATYSGETWRVQVAFENGTRDGVATIEVETPDGQPRERRVRIEARWPDVPLQRSTYRKNLVLHLPDSGDSP